MSSHGISTDYQKLNVLLDECGQHVSEVGIQQLYLQRMPTHPASTATSCPNARPVTATSSSPTRRVPPPRNCGKVSIEYLFVISSLAIVSPAKPAADFNFSFGTPEPRMRIEK